MKVFTTDKIRNVVLLGHAGSGKTSLVEAINFLSGATNRMGTVDNGNTISDYDKEEIKRKISIKTSVVPVEWEGYKVNLLDTPGFPDFIGEVEEAVAVADAAIIVGTDHICCHCLSEPARPGNTDISLVSINDRVQIEYHLCLINIDF